MELGVGFHPDLTGEENVYLNGAMLGFDHAEMKERMGEIVSFSEIGNFIYSPIRTYSSGMLMRLGFSIATCVNPDILLVDEILAVGDEAFQQKCFARMMGFKASGKTIIIVSHSMDVVEKFCDRVILLQGGTSRGGRGSSLGDRPVPWSPFIDRKAAGIASFEGRGFTDAGGL